MTSLPLVVEGAVAILLLVTICYCAVLERRIRAFHSGQDGLRLLVAELDKATTRAQSAVAGLAATSKSAEINLEAHLNEARSLTRTLAAGNRGRSSKTRRTN